MNESSWYEWRNTYQKEIAKGEFFYFFAAGTEQKAIV